MQDVGVGVARSSFNAQLYDDLIRHVDLSLRDDVAGTSLPLKPSVRKYIEKWLLQRASCRLRPAWTDLGALFWPRWVRRGSCDEDDEDTDRQGSSKPRRDGRRRHSARSPRSCSWPPGMRCVPEASETVRLLHWHCGVRRRSGRRGRGRRPGVSQSPTKYHADSTAAAAAAGAWKWRCKWKKVPYAVTTACFCSC